MSGKLILCPDISSLNPKVMYTLGDQAQKQQYLSIHCNLQRMQFVVIALFTTEQ